MKKSPIPEIDKALRLHHAALDVALTRHEDGAALENFTHLVTTWLFTVGLFLPEYRVLGGLHKPRTPTEKWFIHFELHSLGKKGLVNSRIVKLEHIDPIVLCFRAHTEFGVLHWWPRFFGRWILPLFPTFVLRVWLREMANIYVASAQELAKEAVEKLEGRG